MRNDHIKQHYIPQFIIRKFCKKDGKVYYYDKIDEKLKLKWPNEIFEENSLYKYLYENKEDPNIIEKDLAEFERVASEIIKPFRENYSISLNYQDNELLKYFFFIMMFRSKHMTATYNKDIFYHNKSANLSAQELDEFYKKNLGKLVKYRSLNEAVVDKEINQQFIRYAIDIIFGNTNKHFVLFESSENIDFILGDAYPIGFGQSINYFGVLPLTCFIFPVSYKRAIALVDTYSMFHDNIKQLKIKNKKWYELPKKFGEGYLIQCQYLDDEFIININNGILNGSIDGVCFRDSTRTGLSQLSGLIIT